MDDEFVEVVVVVVVVVRVFSVVVLVIVMVGERFVEDEFWLCFCLWVLVVSFVWLDVFDCKFLLVCLFICWSGGVVVLCDWMFLILFGLLGCNGLGVWRLVLGLICLVLLLLGIVDVIVDFFGLGV